MKRVPESLLRSAFAARNAMAAALEMQDAFLQQLEELATGEQPEAAPQFPPVGECTHPSELRQDTTTSAQPRSFFCRGCRHTSDELLALKPKQVLDDVERVRVP